MTNHWGSAMSVVPALAMAMFLVVAVVGIFVLVRHFSHGNGQAPFTWVEPETVLREQFAQGQIDEGTFRSKLALLRDQR